jgi:propanol-preferring alcohol dehydrogenase
MKAMLLKDMIDLSQNDSPLIKEDISKPVAEGDEVLLKVTACAVCHTELDEIEGRTPPANFPVIPGHQVVGIVEEKGQKAQKYNEGDRLGVGWIYASCGECRYCKSGNENLCSEFKATGRDANGGYAEYMKVPEKFAFPIPESLGDSEAAPLLCAGAIGYRSLMLSKIENGMKLGLTGFGASGHLVLKMVKKKFPDTQIFVFARNPREREHGRELGAVWAGESQEESPDKLDAIIDTTPVWKPVVDAMKNLAPGGRLVINAIRKEDMDKKYLMELDYSRDLWMEKEIKSVANVSRSDVSEFLQLADEMNIRPDYEEYRLEDANRALTEMKRGKIRGAKVLRMKD